MLFSCSTKLASTVLRNSGFRPTFPYAVAAALTRSQVNMWQFMRQNWLSNRTLKSFDGIIDHCCYACNTVIGQPWKIMSIARRNWATVGHSS